VTLASGTRLGPYEIVGAIGAGGMGDVYRARDTRLDRTVAIKVVRTDFSERFEREARSISALNHPNICTLHDVGEQEGTAYLVMEFVEGAPIAGPLPVADVVRYGIQICEALDAAHRKSIVHRDLKPANILATRSGIKLLDFGLAKLQAKPTDSAAGNDATVAALTGAHTIVGTPQYMSPEQIEGREADARSDIFALGCVLYELITGKRAFEGQTTSNVMAAVLAKEPRRISELAPVTPPALEWTVMRCLEKDPDARWQSARDVALQLKWVADHPAETTAAVAATSRRGLLTGLTIGILATAIAAAGLSAWRKPAATTTTGSAPVSLSIPVPAELLLRPGQSLQNIAISPDSRTIAFTGSPQQRDGIYLRKLDQFEAVRVAGTDDGFGPFFSPNGEWIGFFDGLSLKRVPVAGGVALPIADAPALRGAVWLPDDTIVYSPTTTGGLMRVPAHGGTPTALTTLDATKREKTHRSLVALPGGKVVVFVIGSEEISTYDEARIVALTLETGKVTELVNGGYAPAYSPTGHLLYVRDASLFAVPLDPATLTVGTTPTQVVKNVATLPNYGMAEFAVAANGTLVFATGGNLTQRDQIRWLDRHGVFELIQAPEQHYFSVDVSPDGRMLLLGVGSANNSIWSYDIARNQPTRLTFRHDVVSATWDSDSSHVTYWSGTDLRSLATDGSGAEEVLIPASIAAGRVIRPHNWSADGRKLAVTVFTPGKGEDVALYLRGQAELFPISDSRYTEREARVSPDGEWLAYVSSESGRDEAYVRATDGSGTRVQVSNGGGGAIRWSGNGAELLWGGPAGATAASFTPGKPPRIGEPTLLIPSKGLRGIVDLDTSATGQRFATVVSQEPPVLTEIRVVLNWTQALAGVR
jgi:serine/threonine protein kinase/WD40 repeat protein